MLGYPIGDHWIGPRAYRVAKGQRILGVEILHDFVTDGGSIPLCFAWFADPFGIGLPAFVVHDYRYRLCDSGITRDEADAELLRNLVALGMSKAKARTLYYNIRAFGGRYWRD